MHNEAPGSKVNTDHKPGDMVQRQESSERVAVLISENEFHVGYWKVLANGNVEEWFSGNFKVVQKSDIQTISCLMK